MYTKLAAAEAKGKISLKKDFAYKICITNDKKKIRTQQKI